MNRARHSAAPCPAAYLCQDLRCRALVKSKEQQLCPEEGPADSLGELLLDAIDKAFPVHTDRNLPGRQEIEFGDNP